MARINPIVLTVTDIDLGAGKAIVEFKGGRVTWTLDTSEDSGLVKLLAVGVPVQMSLEVLAEPRSTADEYTTVAHMTEQPILVRDEHYGEKGEHDAPAEFMRSVKHYEVYVEPEPTANAQSTTGMPAQPMDKVKDYLGM